MKFKIDENLPKEIAELLQRAGHDAETVVDEGLKGDNDANIAAKCKREDRTLVTLDLGFSDITAYRPEEFPGIIVLRVHRQDKPYLISLFGQVVRWLDKEALAGRLWIVEEGRVRIRGDKEKQKVQAKTDA